MYRHGAAGKNETESLRLSDQKEKDFTQASGVIDEIVEGVAVLENLMFLADRAGIARFDLGPLLADYIGGVQLVADFAFYRTEIVGRFHNALIEIVKQSASYCTPEELEIYLVAHSEGTVVTLAGILEALLAPTQRRRDGANEVDMSWIGHVRGLMTIGSPLDKHVLLWPNLWTDIGLPSPEAVSGGHREPQAPPGLPPDKIRWHNYYDLGDPVAFDVSETRRYLEGMGFDRAFDWTDAKESGGMADYGFSRYLWPGYAHLGYWTDPAVFGHFIRNVAFSELTGVPDAPRPPSSNLVDRACRWISFAIAFVVQFVAVAVLVGTLNPFVAPGNQLSLLRCVVITLGMGCQLAGLCIAARLPRLGGRAARNFSGFCRSLAIFVAACAMGTLSLWPRWLEHFALTDLRLSPDLTRFLEQVPDPVSRFWYLTPALGFVAILMCWWPRRFPPRKRYPRAGRTILVGCVALLATTMVTITLFTVGPQSGPSYLAPTLGLLAFVYAWWIGVVLFDLAYIWNGYIRNSRVVETLRAWMHGREAAP
ncbi:hypothetical protein [Paraburkholderia sp. J12]|uniref:hypothetical protein n=1 Tax=Paraburkholderia sp. J12 TaxID=2805432 RepID=UPI002ABDE2D6|nr:hypothetical protein [Paraburkholderia sp. J12]